MMVAAIVLSQLLQQCAPNIGSRTMSAIVRVESDSQPYAIHDNTLRKTFVARDARQGIAWAKQLLAQKHSVDLGLSQINDANLSRLQMSVSDAFDPCRNLRGGATILLSEYRAASQSFGPGQFALRRALGAYNTGSLYAGYAYVDRILAAAGFGATQDFVPDLERTQSTPAYVAKSVPDQGLDVKSLGVKSLAPASRASAAPPKKAKRNPFSSPILISTGSARRPNTHQLVTTPATSPSPVAPSAASAAPANAVPASTPAASAAKQS